MLMGALPWHRPPGRCAQPVVMFGWLHQVAIGRISEYAEIVRRTGMRPPGALHLGQPVTVMGALLCVCNPSLCLASPFDFT